MPAFPIEIFEHILSFAFPSSLASVPFDGPSGAAAPSSTASAPVHLLLVSRLFHDLGRPLLYHSIFVVKASDWSLFFSETDGILVNGPAGRARAALVRDLAIDLAVDVRAVSSKNGNADVEPLDVSSLTGLQHLCLLSPARSHPAARDLAAIIRVCEEDVKAMKRNPEWDELIGEAGSAFGSEDGLEFDEDTAFGSVVWELEECSDKRTMECLRSLVKQKSLQCISACANDPFNAFFFEPQAVGLYSSQTAAALADGVLKASHSSSEGIALRLYRAPVIRPAIRMPELSKPEQTGVLSRLFGLYPTSKVEVHQVQGEEALRAKVEAGGAEIGWTWHAAQSTTPALEQGTGSKKSKKKGGKKHKKTTAKQQG